MSCVMMFVAGSGHGEGCHHSCHRGCRRPVDLRGMVWVNGHGEGCHQTHHRGCRQPVDLRALVGVSPNSGYRRRGRPWGNDDCESLTPTRGATQQSVDCEPLTPTRGATQQSVDCESLTPTRGATQQSVDSKIVPVSSIAPEGWGPKEGGNATSGLHSRGSPTKETKSEVKTYAGGHHDAPRNKAWIQRLSRFPQ